MLPVEGVLLRKKVLQAIVDICSVTNPEHDYKQFLFSYLIDNSIVGKSIAE